MAQAPSSMSCKTRIQRQDFRLPGFTFPRSLVVVAALMAASITSPAASAFNIGPYRLGMSNKEAAKIGLTNCSSYRAYIACTGVLSDARYIDCGRSKSSIGEPELTFDSRSKLLVGAKTHVANWDENDPCTASLMTLLKIDPCPPGNRASSDGPFQTCYVSPNRSRFIYYTTGTTVVRKYYAGFLTIDLERSNRAALRIEREKEVEKKRQNLDRFQSGR